MDVAVSLGPDRSGKLADSGISVGDADTGTQRQVIFHWGCLREVQCGKEVNAGRLIENAERSLSVSITQVQNRIRAEDLGQSTSKCPGVVGLTPCRAGKTLRGRHVIVRPIEPEERRVVRIKLVVDPHTDLVSFC